MKTYPILQLLTDEEVERMLATQYRRIFSHALRNSNLCCPMGEALRIPGIFALYAPAPTTALIAETLEDRTDIDYPTLVDMAYAFTNDVDKGKIKPEDLAEIVRLSRER